MASINTSKISDTLAIDEKYYNGLEMEGFSRMLKDPSYCYKFYWLRNGSEV